MLSSGGIVFRVTVSQAWFYHWQKIGVDAHDKVWHHLTPSVPLLVSALAKATTRSIKVSKYALECKVALVNCCSFPAHPELWELHLPGKIMQQQHHRNHAHLGLGGSENSHCHTFPSLPTCA